jgi:hypothetical protein
LLWNARANAVGSSGETETYFAPTATTGTIRNTIAATISGFLFLARILMPLSEGFYNI